MTLLEILTTAEKIETYLDKIRPDGIGSSNIRSTCIYVTESLAIETHNDFTHDEFQRSIMSRLLDNSNQSKILKEPSR